MILVTAALAATLRANAQTCARDPDFDPVPVLKLFNPVGAATWLATELDADGDTLFGLADLGFGCPELGAFSLAEIASVRLPVGLIIERDRAFRTAQPLSRWARAARETGSLAAAERILAAADDELPPPERGGG